MLNKKFLKAILVIIWIPFAFNVVYSAFINPDDISPEISTLAAIFAKTSTVWSTLAYILMEKNINFKIQSAQKEIMMV